ncbi:hypothetical protein niasHT_000165 [Heterodera trifolii]|uniref:PDZ domain-containing protein n=1 Tax=Heterodera trifolii TaxID=157864 RepID=A0ABD2LSZ1_9BILA
MFRSPSEPSPFSSTRCPYDTQARCGRPYCLFAHQADDTVDVVEDTANDVLVLDSDHLSDGGRSSVGTEIRQENPTDTANDVLVSVTICPTLAGHQWEQKFDRKIRLVSLHKCNNNSDRMGFFLKGISAPFQVRLLPSILPSPPPQKKSKNVATAINRRQLRSHADIEVDEEEDEKENKRPDGRKRKVPKLCELCPHRTHQKDHLKRNMSIHRDPNGPKYRYCGAPITPQKLVQHEKTCGARNSTPAGASKVQQQKASKTQQQPSTSDTADAHDHPSDQLRSAPKHRQVEAKQQLQQPSTAARQKVKDVGFDHPFASSTSATDCAVAVASSAMMPSSCSSAVIGTTHSPSSSSFHAAGTNAGATDGGPTKLCLRFCCLLLLPKSASSFWRCSSVLLFHHHHQHFRPTNPNPTETVPKCVAAQALLVAELPFSDSQFDGTVEEVLLVRDARNSLGLPIVGGIDHCSPPFGTPANPGVFISRIVSNSPDNVTRRLRIGYRLLKVVLVNEFNSLPERISQIVKANEELQQKFSSRK